MRGFMRIFKKIITIFISVVSITCLGYIFFADDYFDLFQYIHPDNTVIETVAEDDNYGIMIDVPIASLHYENIDSFNYMQDVSATDADGNDITSEVQYIIKAGNSISNKKIEYFIVRNGISVCSAERDFIIDNYTGPNITFSSDVTLHATEAQDLMGKLLELGVISATDGLGNDITSTVAYSSDAALNTAGTYPVKFTVTNLFNDTYSFVYDIGITGSTTEPVVALTATTATLPLGGEFKWRNYLDYATDPVEGDISTRIYIDDNINNLVPGVYTVTYTATNSQGVSSAPAELTVIVTGN